MATSSSFFEHVANNPVSEPDSMSLGRAEAAKGLVIRNTALLPHPCYIGPLPDSIITIRSALRRRFLQAFHVDTELTPEQITGLDEGLSDGRSWVLISPVVNIPKESFANRVMEQ